MNVTLSLNVDTARMARRLQGKAPVAIARAVNRSMDSVKTVMVREIAKDMGISQKVVRERLNVKKAAPSNNPVAQLTGTAKKIPVIDMGANPKVPSPGNRRGVSWKSHGKRVRDAHAFIAQVGRGQHIGVFKRAGKKRLPIRELMGPSIWLVGAKHADIGLARGREQLVKNLQHELRFALSKAS